MKIKNDHKGENSMAFFGKYALTMLGTALAATTASAQTASTANDWMNRISVSGEVRFRAERDFLGYYTGGIAGTTPGSGTEDYARVRARLGVAGKISDNLSAVTRLSTGRNQYTTFATLGQGNVAEQGSAGLPAGSATGTRNNTGFSQRRDFQLDMAYLNYKPIDEVLVQAGKSPVIFWTPGDSQMVWNLGASLEGAQAKWNPDFGSWHPWLAASYDLVLNRYDHSDFGGNAADNTTDGAPITMLGAQVGVTWKTDFQWATIDVASYQYTNVRGTNASVTGVSGDLSGAVQSYNQALNNTIAADGTYAYDYTMIQAGAEYGINLGFAPLKGYVDYVTNTMTSNDNVGILAGLTLGKLGAQGTWMVGYDYRDVRKDSVMGAYSDVVYTYGGTDVFGHEVQAAYQLWDKAGVGLLWNGARKHVSSNGGSAYELYAIDWYAYF